MSRGRLILPGLMVLMVSCALAADPAPRRESYQDRYSVLSEHNIFLRVRSRPPASRPSYTPPAPRVPEQSLVLRGIVMEEGEPRVYLENLDGGGPMLRLRLGDKVARGTIVEIAIDAVAYEQAGPPVWVQIGQDLTGRTPGSSGSRPGGYSSTATLSSPTSQPAADAAPSPGPLPNPDDPNLSIEERMRLRRAQSLNR